jgi:hypothetical protein
MSSGHCNKGNSVERVTNAQKLTPEEKRSNDERVRERIQIGMQIKDNPTPNNDNHPQNLDQISNGIVDSVTFEAEFHEEIDRVCMWCNINKATTRPEGTNTVEDYRVDQAHYNNNNNDAETALEETGILKWVHY